MLDYGLKGPRFDPPPGHENFLRVRDKWPGHENFLRVRDKWRPTWGAICHGLFKNSHASAEDRTGDPLIHSRALYHVAIKAGLYRKAVQVYYIPNQYPVTYELN